MASFSGKLGLTAAIARQRIYEVLLYALSPLCKLRYLKVSLDQAGFKMDAIEELAPHGPVNNMTC